MGNANSQYKVVEAQHNHEKIWRKIFTLANLLDPSAKLVVGYEKDSDGEYHYSKPLKDSLWDPNCAVAFVLKYIY